MAEKKVSVRLVAENGRQVRAELEGVGDDAGNPAPVTPDGIDALLDIWPVFEAFQHQVLGPHLVLDAEKNGFAPSPNGTSEGATDTANPASGDALSARLG